MRKYKRIKADPDLMGRLREQAGIWRYAREVADLERAKVHALVVEAKEADHSFAQIRAVTGLGHGSIQEILAAHRADDEDVC